MSIRIITTGGTFDKHYDPIKGILLFDVTHLPEAIERARMSGKVILEELAPLDSLDMHDQDRERILASCDCAPETSIVIIHGTDTMRETAEKLGAAKLNKTIVLTGAMIPYEIANSDAQFNLGFACGIVQTLPHGVYLGMNGRIFNWDAVEKNRAAGVFQSKSPPKHRRGQ